MGRPLLRVETIGTADDKADADGVAVLDFRQAQALAREKHVEYVRISKGFPTRQDGPYTVRACVGEYLAFLESERKSAADARYRAEALIFRRSATFPAPSLRLRSFASG